MGAGLQLLHAVCQLARPCRGPVFSLIAVAEPGDPIQEGNDPVRQLSRSVRKLPGPVRQVTASVL